MPEIFVLQTSEDPDDYRQSPPMVNNDRYTPMPDEKSYGAQKPEIYHIEVKNDFQPIPDEPSDKPSSPLIKNSYPTSYNKPELYHVTQSDVNDNIPDHRSSPAFISNNRISPTPQLNSDRQGPELYHIQVGDEVNHRQSPPPLNNKYKKTTFNDNLTSYDDEHNQQKIEMYMLATTEKENLPSPTRIERTPSPSIPRTKKQEPISYISNDKYDNPVKQRPFPTALYDVPTNHRYVPLSQSKASESIQRSMLKYRFGES